MPETKLIFFPVNTVQFVVEKRPLDRVVQIVLIIISLSRMHLKHLSRRRPTYHLAAVFVAAFSDIPPFPDQTIWYVLRERSDGLRLLPF